MGKAISILTNKIKNRRINKYGIEINIGTSGIGMSRHYVYPYMLCKNSEKRTKQN